MNSYLPGTAWPVWRLIGYPSVSNHARLVGSTVCVMRGGFEKDVELQGPAEDTLRADAATYGFASLIQGGIWCRDRVRCDVDVITCT